MPIDQRERSFLYNNKYSKQIQKTIGRLSMKYIYMYIYMYIYNMSGKIRIFFSSVQLLSCVQLFSTPWIAARQASLSITNSRSSLKLTSIESVMPSSHLILCHPLFLLPSIFPSIRVFSNVSALHIRWPKYWSFSFNISPSNEYPGRISFTMDWLDLLTVQGTQDISPTSQFKIINSLVLNLLYGPTFTSVHNYWKNYSCDYMDLCW